LGIHGEIVDDPDMPKNASHKLIALGSQFDDLDLLDYLGAIDG
jgi:hypothetical protein